MKQVQVASVPGDLPTTDNLLILAEKETLDQLSAVLTAHEYEFLRQYADRDVKSFFFPRIEGSVMVCILKQDKDNAIALEDARIAGNDALRDLRHYKFETITLRNVCKNNRVLAFAEGMMLGSYQFLKYFTQKEKKEKKLREIRIENTSASEEDVRELQMLTEAVFLARTLVNEPFSGMNSTQLAEATVSAAHQYGFSVEILGKEKIESLKMGGLLAVSKASATPPQFAVLEWSPETKRNDKPIVLVGKGVVYDTGGLSLKPTEGMDYMKCDMAGAATVVGLFAAAALNKLPVHIIGLIPITDNLIGDRAFAPGDVIQMYSGKTVEVLNTDAEGRIILADALHYAKKYKPELVIDYATLTGAAVRALGAQAICYMGSASKKIKHAFEESGMQTYERLVELPLWKEYGEELKSHVADIKNVGGGNAGMITAGKFLEHFTDYPWLHLDIAGPAYLRTANAYRLKEGTGVGVRLTYHFLKNLFNG